MRTLGGIVAFGVSVGLLTGCVAPRGATVDQHRAVAPKAPTSVQTELRLGGPLHARALTLQLTFRGRPDCAGYAATLSVFRDGAALHQRDVHFKLLARKCVGCLPASSADECANPCFVDFTSRHFMDTSLELKSVMATPGAYQFKVSGWRPASFDESDLTALDLSAAPLKCALGVDDASLELASPEGFLRALGG